MVVSEIRNKGLEPKGAYEEAALGFREYWYPVCMSGEVTETPKAFTLLGDPVVMLKRDGEVYALKDECPHRGTQLSMINTRKNLEFPGTPTITCAYHGWTYDVRDGKCVAVIPEGPDSPVPASGVRAKTYPVEVRRGIIWIWMGAGKPVPVEEDIPNLLLDPKAVVKAFYRVKPGHWRFHAENVNGGHAAMVHKSTLRSWFGPEPGTPVLPPTPGYVEDLDGRGISTNIGQGGGAPLPRVPGQRPYPGLGIWHAKPRWQRILLNWFPTRQSFGRPVRGVRSSMLMLPGIFRQPNFPNTSYMYYEWYVPVDEDNYVYFQTMAFWPKNILDRIRYELKYYFWDRPTGPVLFNNQDAAMVNATTNYYRRTGNMRYLTKISPYDQTHTLWRQYCDEQARGVGTAYQKAGTAEAKEASVASSTTAVPAGAGD